MTRFNDEPALQELLSDPIVEALMKADGLSPAQLCETLCQVSDNVVLRSGTNATHPEPV